MKSNNMTKILYKIKNKETQTKNQTYVKHITNHNNCNWKKKNHLNGKWCKILINTIEKKQKKKEEKWKDNVNHKIS